MASVILTNWTVFYSTDTGASGGYKQIRWTGAGTPDTSNNSVNELYSALMDLFSISTQNAALTTTPMRAVTPTVYEVGSFDAGDLEAWFIDPVSVRHLTGGSLNTVNWTRVGNANALLGNPGVVKVPYTTGTQFVVSDIGRSIVHASGDTGILLYFANNEAWIRPTNCTPTHNWDTGSGTFSVTAAGGTGSVTQSGAPKTGERVWANIYTIGSIATGTEVYVTQYFTKFTSWWSSGHVDRLFLTNDGFSSSLIDSGLLSIYAREYGKLYDHYTANLSAGGRSPVPLATSVDGNNTTAQATINALTGVTFTFGATTKDLSNGNGLRPYDVVIDCGGNTIKDVYEYTKNVTRRTSTTSLNGRDGEQYYGVGDIILNVQTDGGFTEGLTVTGGTSGATAVIVGDHATNPYYLVVRDVRGTFANGETVTDSSTGSSTTAASGAVESILITKTAPFGTFAGGKFFGARGVYVFGMAGADANNCSLIDSLGETQNPATSIPITVSNTLSGDRVSVFRALDTNGTIDKAYMESSASANTVGSSTFTIDSGTPIPTDTPAAGKIRLVDSSTGFEHRFRYASWSGLVFTFVTAITGTATSGGAKTVINNSGASFLSADIMIGDLVRNTTDGSWAHVVSIDSDTKITTTTLMGGSDNTWSASDNYSFHTLPVLYENGTVVDTAYVPYLDGIASTTSYSVSVIFESIRNISTRVRIKGLQPYTNNTTQLTSTGYSTSVTRIDDTIVT